MGILTPSPGPDIIFEPSRRAADPKLQDAIKRLTADLEAAEARLGIRKRTRKFEDRKKFRKAVEAIACNCLVVLIYGGGASLAVPRNSSTVQARIDEGGGVYGQHFLHALAIMEHPEIGLIEKLRRGGALKGQRGRQLSTVRPTLRLLEALGEGYSRDSLTRDEAGREVLFLRSEKDAYGRSSNLEFPEHSQRRAQRNAILRLNARLAEAPVFIAPDMDGHLLDKEGRPVDPTNRAVRRIFNNGSWQQGGRLYGGFWQTMRREDRSRLRMRTPESPEGERMATVDYGQLFVRLAYHQARAAIPEGDLYDVFGNGSHRQGVKRIVSAMLYAQGELKRWPDGALELFPAGTKLATVRDAIHRRHPGIAGQFGTGVGYRLMFIESELLLHVLQDLERRGVYALPLHDAVLVAASQADEALDAMVRSVREEIGMELRAIATVPESLVA